MRWSPLLVLVFASVASADAVPADYEPPDCSELTCPPATSPAGGSGHGSCPTGCTPSQRTCETNADCASAGASSECVPVRFCIVRRNTGRLADVPFVEGEPNAAGECTTGEPQIAKLCTYPPPQRSSSSDGGCAAGGRASWSLSLLLLLWLRRLR